MKFWNKTGIQNYLLIILASLIMGININSFINGVGLFPGGFGGIALLVQRIGKEYYGLKIPYSIINYPLNIMLLLFSVRYLGKRFLVSTSVTVLLFGLFTDLLPEIFITKDMLLSSIFGGILNGIVVALCLLAKSSSGGTDILGVLMINKYNLDPWNYILIGNVMLLLVTGFLFGWEKALYSIIFQFTATQVLQLIYRKNKRHTLFIVTDYPQKVYEKIHEITNHGATILSGMGCYKNEERMILYSIVSSMEVKMVIKEIKNVDSGAFINVIKTEQLDGRFYQDV